MSDKLQAWCEEVLTEYHKSYQSPELIKEFAGELARILRNRTDFRLVEPLPEGAVSVVVYVGVYESKTANTVNCSAIDRLNSHDAAKNFAFSGDDTHRVRLEGYAMPVAVPAVKAKAVQP